MHWRTHTLGYFEGRDTSELLYYYNLDDVDIESILKAHNYQVRIFGPFQNRDLCLNYQTRTLWIYDPDCQDGAFTGHPADSALSRAEYTYRWRVLHELAHAKTFQMVKDRFGNFKRAGRWGMELSDKDAAAALVWEDLAFCVQPALGGSIGPAGLVREWTVNMADAVHRVFTGKFSNPGWEGFNPRPFANIDQAREALFRSMNGMAIPDLMKGVQG